MMNLFTAAAYLHYQQCEQEFEQNAIAQSHNHLSTAFDLLDADKSGYLDRAEVLHLVSELRKAHLLPGIAQVRASLVLACLAGTTNRCMNSVAGQRAA